MNAWEYTLTVLSTALAGFDPAPMVIMAAALGAGIRRRHIVGASTLLLGGTAAWGLALTLLLGPRLQEVDWWHLVRQGSIAAWIEFALALGIGGYAAWRAVARRRRRGVPEPEEKPATSPWGLYVTTLVFVGIVIFDLPFDIHVAVAAAQPLPWGVAGWIVWALVSQLPLTLLAVLTAFGRQERFSKVMRRAWDTISPWVNLGLTWLLALVALFLLVDSGAFLLTGQFLVH